MGKRQASITWFRWNALWIYCLLLLYYGLGSSSMNPTLWVSYHRKNTVQSFLNEALKRYRFSIPNAGVKKYSHVFVFIDAL